MLFRSIYGMKLKIYIKIVLLFLILLSFTEFSLSQCDKANNGCSGCELKKNETSKIAQKDEFEEFEEFKQDTNSKPASNEFESFKEDGNNELVKENNKDKYFFDKLYWPLLGSILSIIAGVFIRFKYTRKTRGIFLVASIVFFGFYNGACPCPISSLSHLVIGATGGETSWVYMVWFVGLIPVTYVFGKTWCGWVCHLGALQKFLYMPNK